MELTRAMKQRTAKIEVQRKRAPATERAAAPAVDPQRVYRQPPEPVIEDRSLRASMRERARARAQERSDA